jgi:hypothetical protein
VVLEENAMSAALSIVFTGLCALVTDGDRGPAQVLMVDARRVGEIGGAVLPPHAPTLVASLRGLANAETSNPSRVVAASQGASPAGAATGSVDQIGIWDLTGSEVRVRVPGGQRAGLRVFRPSPGVSSWPSPPRDVDDPDSWRDIRFLANMRTLAGDGRVDPALVGHDGDATSDLPRSVAARVYLEGGSVEAGMPSQRIFRNQLFEFRTARGELRLRQALTDTIRWSLESDAGPIVLEIIPVAGGPAKRLVFTAGVEPYAIYVSNLPAEDDSHHVHSVSGDQAALHFRAYYKLLRNVPQDEPAPQLGPAPAVRTGAGMAGTRFCPPVWFNQLQ